MAKKIDDYAIRLIHHHGQVIEALTQATDSQARETLKLVLINLERELTIDYKLTLPNGIAYDTLFD